MSFWRAAAHGMRTLLRRKTSDANLTAEVEHYFEQAVRDQTERGLSNSAGQRAVRLDMGSMTSVREEVRTSGWENRIETLLADLRYAFRRLRSNPGFTAVAVLSLALGIGANTAIFSLINATLIKRLPVDRPDQVAYVWGGTGAISFPDFVELRDNNTVFDGLAAWGGVTGALGVGNETNVVVGNIVTGNFFSVLGVHPAQGRVLSVADDQKPGAHPVVVISDRLWKTRFAARPDIIGYEIRYNGQPFTVVGVTPPSFNGPVLGDVRDIYVPMMMQAVARPPRAGYSGEMDPDLLNRRTNRG